MIQQESKQMFKVLAPMEKADGSGKKWWMKCGNGFRNRDNSLNLYITSLPIGPNNSKDNTLTLHVREYTEQEMRERNERNATYSARGTLGTGLGTGLGSTSNTSFGLPRQDAPVQGLSSKSAEDIPF